MKTHYFKKWLVLLLALCAGVALQAQAQGNRGGFGGGGNRGFGGGGFGGFGGGGNNRSSTSSSQYTPNGQIGNATVSVDDSGNLVVIGDDATIEQIKQAVAQLDRPKPQVLIKVVFIEVQHTDSSDIGVEGAWRGTGNSTTGLLANAFGVSPVGSVFSPTNLNSIGQQIGNFGPNPPGAGLYQILGEDFQATLRVIAQNGKAQLLSRPSILARDRQPATIVVGQTVPLITSVSYTGLAGTPINNVTYTDVGIILRVTPFITSDGLVQMIVAPETSQIDSSSSVTISPGVQAPIINVRSADTVAITPDGATVVIGGLMAAAKAQNDNKIPFIGDIPLIGNLFKRQTKSGNKSELLIFLTPHIVQSPNRLAALSAKDQNQYDLIQKSVSEQQLDKFLERVPVKKESK